MLFLVRVAQGLVHLGKGLLGLAPYHTDGQLLSGGVAAPTLPSIYISLQTTGTRHSETRRAIVASLKRHEMHLLVRCVRA